MRTTISSLKLKLLFEAAFFKTNLSTRNLGDILLNMEQL
jgi:hypothetical protein